MDSQSTGLSWLKVFFLSTGLALLVSLGFTIISLVIVGFIVSKPIKQFLQVAETSPKILHQQFVGGWQRSPQLDGSKLNILLLGSDALANRQGDPVLTDTIILVSADLSNGQVKMLPFLRDIWIEPAEAKINTLYHYGQLKDPTQPYELLVSELTNLVHIPIHHVLMTTPDQLADLIDAVGGVEVAVPVAFSDSLFPRTDVDIKTERNPKKLYQTISFQTGKQIMSGEVALQYIRSRHGNNGQNNDDERSGRQQLVLSALVTKFLTKETLTSPTTLGNLWKFYQQHFESDLSVGEIAGLVHYRAKQVSWKNGFTAGVQDSVKLDVQPGMLPIAERNVRTGTLTEGVLYNPPITKNKYQGQWVYLITDAAEFERSVRTLLGYE